MNMSLAATMLGCIDFEEFGPVEIGLDPRKFLAEWCHQGELPGGLSMQYRRHPAGSRQRVLHFGGDLKKRRVVAIAGRGAQFFD
jgi:hypothetical protein